VDLQVPGLGLVEDLADVVHRMLDGPDPPGGSGASIFIGAGPGSSQCFASGETFEVRGPTTAWSWGPTTTSRGWDPAIATAPGSSTGLGS
jgi:hypothetical protein